MIEKVTSGDDDEPLEIKEDGDFVSVPKNFAIDLNDIKN